MSNVQEVCCRLCQGTVHKKFKLRLVNKYLIDYLECSRCGSLQTETPYWLHEVYNHNLAPLDTGAAQRTITNLAAAYVVARLFGLRNVLDFGGGDGLLCRLLRDYGVNCYSVDKYATAIYAQSFGKPDFDAPDLLLAFEVIEHFANPSTDVAGIFEKRPGVVLLSTGQYREQGPDWWYLSPESGQHVFFYSAKAIDFLGKEYGYSVVRSGNYWILYQKGRAWPRVSRLIGFALKEKRLRFVKAGLCFMKPYGVVSDFEALRDLERPQ